MKECIFSARHVCEALSGAVLAVLLLGAGERTVMAQVSSIAKPAIDVERLWLEPGPGGFLAATDASLLLDGEGSVSVLASLMTRPIVLRNVSTRQVASVPVRVRLGYELALARGLGGGWQVGLALPLVAAQDGDRLQTIGLSEQSLAPVALGDLRVHGKLSIEKRTSLPVEIAMVAHLRLPTGDADNFAGEAGPVIGAGLIASYEWDRWRLALNLGARIRTKSVILISPARAHASEVTFVAAGEYRLPSLPLGLLVEYAKVAGDGHGPSPAEARIGVSAFLLSRATLKLAAGRGVTPGEVGAPQWRAMMLFEYLGR